ncbi:unnamed protein product, partial [Phaeothamnion confervicola]
MLTLLGLEMYLPAFHKEGFEFDAVLLCEESDFAEVGLKKGHRMKLLRAVSEYK